MKRIAFFSTLAAGLIVSTASFAQSAIPATFLSTGRATFTNRTRSGVRLIRTRTGITRRDAIPGDAGW